MTHPSSVARVSIVPLAAGLLGACVIGSLIGLLASVALGWNSQPTDSWSRLETAAGAGICWLIGALFGCVMFFAVTRLALNKVPGGMLVSSGVRAALALLNGLGLSLTQNMETKSFWVAFLAAGLACLMWETVWAVNTMRRGYQTKGTSAT